MNRLEKIFAVGGFVMGLSLLGFGLYRDNKFSDDYKRDYIINTIIKGVGLLSLAVGSGLVIRGVVVEEDRRYEKKRKIYPR
jgi:hypothetical protein